MRCNHATDYADRRAREAAEKKVVQKIRDSPRTRLAVKRGKQKVQLANINHNRKKISNLNNNNTKKKVISKVPVILIVSKEKEPEEMLGDSGGLSANNKATGQDDDGNKSPFPERVFFF